MLQTEFPASFLSPEDLALLSRVLETIGHQNGTAIDIEAQAATLLQLFQSGVCGEEELIEAMTRRERR